MTTHEAKAQIKTQLAEAGIEITRTQIGGNARWIHVRIADEGRRETAAAVLRVSHNDVRVNEYGIYVIR